MKIVLANGTFDPLHIGHVWHLLQAKEMGDKLIASVTDDDSVRYEKGPKRPVFSAQERAQFLAQLRCVDGVIIVKDALDAIQKVKPAIFVKGDEYRNKIAPEHLACCANYGVEIRFTDGPIYSSTKLLKHYETRSR